MVGAEKGIDYTEGAGKFWWGVEMFCILIVVRVTQLYSFIKISTTANTRKDEFYSVNRNKTKAVC